MLRRFFQTSKYVNKFYYKIQQGFSTLLFQRFQLIGVSKNFIEQAEKSKQVSNHLEDLHQKYKESIYANKKKANLIISLSSKLTPTLESYKYELAQYIINEQINSNADLDKALAYVKDFAKKNNQLDWKQFEQTLGLGIQIDESQIISDIVTELNAIPNLNKELLCSDKKYSSQNLRIIRDKLKQHESKLIFQCFDKAVQQFIENQEKSTSHQGVQDKDGVTHSNQGNSIFIQEDLQTHIWDKIASLKGRDLCYENNSKQAYEKHLKERNGYQYIFRFPPEPNGYLHLGHAKALRTNFYSAEKLGGICYLRYDDTNPEKEKLDYIESIKDNVLWFGFKPYNITYSSDYFQEIYECAIKLINKGLAYVCELSQEQMAELRQNKQASPHRNRSIENNLRMFEDMKQGKYKENEVCLRMKIDYQHPNPTMRDPVMYRVKYYPHPKTGKKWCVYPMYDFTHCLCDSFENITHSLCTLEFEIRRDLYYWILDSLDLYKPVVWEYSRLNVSNSVLSKRKLLTLINNKVVDGWDDPRLLTINALRRRGVRPEAISAFVDLVNVARRGNENIIDQKLLDYCIRQDLENISPRTMAILEPIKLQIVNFDDFNVKQIKVPLFPKEPNRGFRELNLSSELLVDASDVRESEPNKKQEEIQDQQKKSSKKVDKNTFIGIYPGSQITLKYFGVIEVLSVNMLEKVVKCKLISTEEKDRRESIGQIHWINPNEAIQCQVKVYNDLFTAADPNQFDNILDAINPNSLEEYNNAYINKDLIQLSQEYKTFQFERVGYFSLDQISDIQENKIRFNRTVSLKDRVNRSNL
ncbi:hypothetical protein ABPG72_022256 [Tetrahymena utriculariae]